MFIVELQDSLRNTEPNLTYLWFSSVGWSGGHTPCGRRAVGPGLSPSRAKLHVSPHTLMSLWNKGWKGPKIKKKAYLFLTV